MLLQQGDVLLKKIDRIPKDVKKMIKNEKGYVLAEGEVTGHAHVINNDIECYEKNGVLFLKIDHATPLKHEEHKTIDIPAGIWEVVKVQEYDHFLEETKNVLD